MKELSTKELQAGMKTAEPVETPRGQLIVNSDVELTDKLISRIKFFSIPVVKIQTEDEVEKESDTEESIVIPKGNVQEPTYSQKVKKTPEFQKFQLDYSIHMSDCKNVFDGISSGDAAFNSQQLLDKTNGLLQPTQTSIQLFDMLHNMRQIDDSIYAHSINVGLICYNIGKWLKFSGKDLEVLMLCGLLHDIGKTQIPPAILNKPGKYTDEEFTLVKTHPQLGYDILKNQDMDEHIKKSALMHHERCDGSGYPSGLKMDEIDDFALIVAIADVYDAMTAARTYRAPLCPFQVIESFEKEGLQKYKPKYILTFLERIATTYQNNRVMLSNGKSGNVVLLNSKHLSKPIVELDDGTFLDLATEPGISIVSIL